MKQDKFLTGILIGIGALILLALGLFFTRQGSRDYVSDVTPDGVVHNYVLAVINQDYEKAYGYLADARRKPTYWEFVSYVSDRGSGANINIENVETFTERAIVSLSVYYPSSDPFSSGYWRRSRANLVNQNGEWKLDTMESIWPYWSYDWYR